MMRGGRGREGEEGGGRGKGRERGRFWREREILESEGKERRRDGGVEDR